MFKPKKIMFTTLAILTVGFILRTSVQAINTSVDLSIQGGSSVTIGATGAINFGTIGVSSVATGIQKQLSGADYFWVEDLKGANSGWYTTISVTDLTGTNGSITGGNISMKVQSTETTLISGTPNANVTVNGTLLTYTPINSAVTFIQRTAGINAGKLGKYAAYPAIQISIPAYQSVGTYHGTITYTIIEN